MIGGPDRSFHCERRMFRRSRTAETKTRYFSRDYWPGIRKGIGRCRWNDQCQDGDAEQDLTITGQINSSGAVLYRRKAADERKKFRIFWWIVLSSRRWQRNGRTRKYQAASRIFDALSRLRIATAVPSDNAFHPCEADFQKHRAYPVERSENICGKLGA